MLTHLSSSIWVSPAPAHRRQADAGQYCKRSGGYGEGDCPRNMPITMTLSIEWV